MCDFSGFQEPEMVKTRPVVILRKHRTNSKLVTVVPLSMTKPAATKAYHHEFSTNPIPTAMPWEITWAKCDMVATISIDRLDRFKVKIQGLRQYIEPHINDEDFQAIRQCVAAALGLTDLMEKS